VRINRPEVEGIGMEGRNKVAIVTGATGTLGKAVTKGLLDSGMRVVAVFKHEGSRDALLEYLGSHRVMLDVMQADVTVESEVRSLFSQVERTYGHVDVLVNLVGTYLGGHEVRETSTELWDALMNINLRSGFLCCREALPLMIRQNYGKIVNVAARPALEKRYRAKNVAYAISKAGVLVLTETIAEETKKYDINVNAIVPSTIDTPENRKNIPQGDFSKWLRPEDVAKVILLLVSDDSKVTSGAAVPVYGKA
jgi:NAD(P)-dependent dehydrogenase (short-subunit alcohol dehydrogenase family)